jgi:hypothetical protein
MGSISILWRQNAVLLTVKASGTNGYLCSLMATLLDGDKTSTLCCLPNIQTMEAHTLQSNVSVLSAPIVASNSVNIPWTQMILSG